MRASSASLTTSRGPRSGRSAPTISPLPRTAVSLPASCRDSSPARKRSPSRRTFASSASSSITSSVASAAAATSGPPPKVEPWSPASSTSAASPRATQAPIGSPDASDFAVGEHVGLDRRLLERPERAGAPHAALDLVEHEQRAACGRRPRAPPTSISSAIGQTPDSPWTGSIMTAAVRSETAAAARSRRRAARRRSRARAARTAPAWSPAAWPTARPSCVRGRRLRARRSRRRGGACGRA